MRLSGSPPVAASGLADRDGARASEGQPSALQSNVARFASWDARDTVPEPSTRLAATDGRTWMTDGPVTLPEIRLVDLSKHFQDVRAVDSISMDIQPGEFFSLL